MTSPWGRLAEEPTYVLTADQDWAPEWANETLLAYAEQRGLPLHVFRTSASLALDRAAAEGRISQGWHPNLFPGSSHGATDEEIVDFFTKTFPGAVSVRTHGFREGFRSWRAFAAAGIRYDSQHATACAGHLLPVVHATGIRRLPVYLEDDVWLDTFPDTYDLAPVAHTLHTGGLKIFNVHPVHLALNTPSWAFYEAARPLLYGTTSDGTPRDAPYAGGGVATLMDVIVDAVGTRMTAFPAVCAEVDALIAETPALVGGLLPDWRGVSQIG
jgi:hypothetical protein